MKALALEVVNSIEEDPVCARSAVKRYLNCLVFYTLPLKKIEDWIYIRLAQSDSEYF